jgi:hypothetical protein
MVDLEAVSAGTTVGDAPVAVAVEDRPAQRWGNAAGSPPVDHRSPLFADDGHFEGRLAEDTLEGFSSDTGPGLQRDTCFPTTWGGLPGIDEDGDLRWWGIVRDADLDQGGGSFPGAVHPLTVGRLRKVVHSCGQRLVDEGACGRKPFRRPDSEQARSRS